MDEKPVVAPLTVVSAMDAQGNVVVWDHGPQPPIPAPDGSVNEAEKARYEADVRAWDAEYLGLPQPLTMPSSDAAHSIGTDPIRYTLEPVGLDEGAVAAKVKEMQDQRALKEKAAAVRAEAVQLAADRKAAVTAIMADHRAALEADQAKAAESRRRPLPTMSRAPKFGSQTGKQDKNFAPPPSGS